MAVPVDSIYFYNPSVPATVLFTVLYVLPTIALAYLTCFRHRSWYLLALPIGALLEVGGYAARTYSVKNVDNVASYATSISLVIVAPLFAAAADYVLLGRLMLFVLPANAQKILGVKARFMMAVFVTSDVFSFLIQVSGSGVASSQDWAGTTGINILLAGLGLQLATNICFLYITGVFYIRTVRNGMVSIDAPENWRKVLYVIISSLVLILIRSIYRLIEFIVGFGGYLFRTEWPFYVLESIPMLFAFTLFCIWYPGEILPKQKPAQRGLEAGKEEMTELSGVATPDHRGSGSQPGSKS